MSKIPHRAFIELCKLKGINIQKITRSFVYTDEFVASLPNCHPELLCQTILPTMGFKDFAGKHTTLKDSIRRNQYIQCIKILREYFGLSLMDSKKIVDDNMAEWQKICGKEEPRTSASYQTAPSSPLSS